MQIQVSTGKGSSDQSGAGFLFLRSNDVVNSGKDVIMSGMSVNG